MRSRLTTTLQRLTTSDDFREFAQALIVLNALIIGVEAWPGTEELDALWSFLLWSCQFLFSFELAIRIGAHGRAWRDFFKDSWNCLDFVAIVLGWAPVVGAFAPVVRCLRLLRVLRLVSRTATLRSVISGRAASDSLVLPRVALAALLLYVTALCGHYLLGEVIPAGWGDLRLAALSVWRILSLHAAASVLAPVLEHAPWGLFIAMLPYLVVGMIVINGYLSWLTERRARK